MVSKSATMIVFFIKLFLKVFLVFCFSGVPGMPVYSPAECQLSFLLEKQRVVILGC